MVLDLGSAQVVTKVRLYQDGNYRFGSLGDCNVYVSNDPESWGAAVWTGDLDDDDGWNESGAFSKAGRYVLIEAPELIFHQCKEAEVEYVPSIIVTPSVLVCEITVPAPRLLIWDASNIIIEDGAASVGRVSPLHRHNHRVQGRGLYVFYQDQGGDPQEYWLTMERASSDPATSWSDLGDTVADGIFFYDVSSALDSTGLIHVVALGSNLSGTGYLRYCTFNTTTHNWSAWTTITTTDIGWEIKAGGWLYGIGIDVDADDKPHVVYSNDDEEIMYTEKTGESWSTPAELYTAGVANRWPTILIGQDDIIRVVWGSDTGSQINVLYRENDGSWQGTETVLGDISTETGRYYYPAIAITPTKVAIFIGDVDVSDPVEAADNHYDLRLIERDIGGGSWVEDTLPASYSGSPNISAFETIAGDMAAYGGAIYLIFADSDTTGAFAFRDNEGNWIDPPAPIPDLEYGGSSKTLMSPQFFIGKNEPRVERVEFVFWWEGTNPGIDHVAYASCLWEHFPFLIKPDVLVVEMAIPAPQLNFVFKMTVPVVINVTVPSPTVVLGEPREGRVIRRCDDGVASLAWCTQEGAGGR